MVNFIVVSEYSGGPTPGDRVKIGGGPLYPLERVQALASKPGGLLLWTRKCVRDVANLTWDADDVASVISALTPGDVQGFRMVRQRPCLGRMRCIHDQARGSGLKPPARNWPLSIFWSSQSARQDH